MSHALDRFLEQYAFRHPVPSTRAGIRLHDHELPGWSREAREDELDEFEAMTVALDEEHEEAPDDATLATDRHALEAHLARATMDARQLAFESGFFEDRNPQLWVEEISESIRSLVERVHIAGDPDRTMDDVASIAMRLHDVPRFLEDLPGTIASSPLLWRERALRGLRETHQMLSALIDEWITTHVVDQESATWLREALTTALDALDRLRDLIAEIPDASPDATHFGTDAHTALLTRACFLASPTNVLLERASEEWQQIEPLLLNLDAESPFAHPIVHRLPTFVAQSPNRLGRLAAGARPAFTDALPGVWLTDAWSAYLEGFCDGDGELLDHDLDTLPTSAIASRAFRVTQALMDVRLHTEGLSLDDAQSLIRDMLGVTTIVAEEIVTDVSMSPGRAVHAWFGAHALHQTRRVLLGRGVADHATFAVRAMSYGAIPAPLLSRLLLIA